MSRLKQKAVTGCVLLGNGDKALASFGFDVGGIYDSDLVIRQAFC